MISEGGAVIPTEEEIELEIDKQFSKIVDGVKMFKCGLCSYWGNMTEMNYHKLGQGH